jgi:MFS transporter, CP family, cyanate transporter
MATAPGATAPGALPLYRLVLLWFIGTNLRMAVLALPPVLPDIQHQLHLSETALSALTNLPVLLLALAAVLGSAVVARFGPRLALLAGLVVVGLSSGARGLGGTAGLFIASTALGLGIAILQPTMPSITRAWFAARVGFATSIYSNGMVVGEALAASLTLPLVVPVAGSWQKALVFWGLPALLAAGLLALPRFTVPAPSSAAPLRWWPNWADSVTWRTGLLQGGGSVLYFGTNAFLPTYLHAAGHPGLVAPSLAALNTSQLAAALVVALPARRGVSPQVLLGVCATLALAGLVGIVLAPGPLAIAGSAIVGICSAVALIVALTMPALLVGPDDVHRLAAGMTTIGYLSAFLFPLAGGVAWQLSGNSALAFVPEAIGALLFGTVLVWPGPRMGQRLAVTIQ